MECSQKIDFGSKFLVKAKKWLTALSPATQVEVKDAPYEDTAEALYSRDQLSPISRFGGEFRGELELLKAGHGASEIVVGRLSVGESLSKTITKLSPSQEPQPNEDMQRLLSGCRIVNQANSSFNAHYYSLCRAVKTPKSGAIIFPAIIDKPVHVDGQATALTRRKNPVGTLLANHFEKLADLSPSQTDYSTLKELVEFGIIEDGDIVVFDGKAYRDGFIHRAFTHSGILRVKNKLIEIESKLGEGPIVSTSIERLKPLYHADRISFWRRIK